MDKIRCPCPKCEGRGKLVLLRIVRNHLVLNGRYPLFRVWKGPGPIDHSNEKWVEASRWAAVNPMLTKVEVEVMDEAVNVNQLLDDYSKCQKKNMKVKGLQACFRTIM